MFDDNNIKRELLGLPWLTYIGIIVISMWGGAVSYFSSGIKFTWRSLLTSLSSAAFAGMVMFLVCEYAGVPGPLKGALAGLAGHAGTPAIIKMLRKYKPIRAFLDSEQSLNDEAGRR